jgi:hypothetical protein
MNSIGRLAAYATPIGLSASPDERQEQRNWIVRFAADLPETWNADEAAARLTEKAAAQVHAAREARGLPPDAPGQAPVVRLLPVDARHLVVSIVTIKQQDDDAHAYLVAASAALRALDEMNAIDDIQGFPRRYWEILIGPPDGASRSADET